MGVILNALIAQGILMERPNGKQKPSQVRVCQQRRSRSVLISNGRAPIKRNREVVALIEQHSTGRKTRRKTEYRKLVSIFEILVTLAWWFCLVHTSDFFTHKTVYMHESANCPRFPTDKTV